MFDTHDLAVRIRAGTPLLLIETQEEALLTDGFRHVVAELLRPCWRWSITSGLSRLDLDDPSVPSANDSSAVLDVMRRESQRGIWLLLDFNPYLRYAMNIRMLREIVLGQSAAPQTVVLIGSTIELPPELEPLAARFDMRLPNDAELTRLLREEAFAYSRENAGKNVRIDTQAQRTVIRYLRGLSLHQARRITRELIYADGLIGPDDIPRAQQARFGLLGRDGVVSLEPDVVQMDQVAGLNRLKHWIQQRRAVFTAESPPKGLDRPRGMLLLGVQGAGKSLAAKACAGGFGVPLLRLDFGALYNKFHGETERNLRDALATADAMAPCVLWCDEIEKGLATSDSDDGVSRRVLGTLLTWMNERRAPVFIVATANDIQRLPPEFLRKGRFDEVFFVDLPGCEARHDTFAIHLRRRDQDLTRFDLDSLAASSDGFSGAEIEQAIVSALYDAYADSAALSDDRIRSALARTRPLSVLMGEHIAALRAWAHERCVPAD